jgi:hypothetical protein
MSSQTQAWSVYRGEDAAIVLTGEDSTNPSAWAIVATVSTYPAQSPVGLEITPSVGGSGPYTLTIALTRAQTSALTGGEYVLDVFRTNAGSSTRLAGGKLSVLTPVRLPA